LSSHILNEVEQVCDSVAIINQGEIVRTRKVADLLANEISNLRLLVTPQDKAFRLLQKNIATSVDKAWLITSVPHKHVPTLIKYLVGQGLDIHQVAQKGQSLEEYFFAVTQKGTRMVNLLRAEALNILNNRVVTGFLVWIMPVGQGAICLSRYLARCCPKNLPVQWR
jgi:hypothetical protein